MSFLLARAGLEEALDEHRDDLSHVGRVSHDFGLYRIGRAERGCHVHDRVYFRFLDDGEAAIAFTASPASRTSATTPAPRAAWPATGTG